MGSCWNLSGTWQPSTKLTCDLQFDTGGFGTTPPSQRWSNVDNLTVAAPFVLPLRPAVGYFGPDSGPFLITIVVSIQFPATPGSYAFSGALWVN
jgi:hypothetical protein